MRDGVSGKGRHWRDNRTLGSREAIQSKKFWLEFRLEKRLEIPF